MGTEVDPWLPGQGPRELCADETVSTLSSAVVTPEAPALTKLLERCTETCACTVCERRLYNVNV